MAIDLSSPLKLGPTDDDRQTTRASSPVPRGHGAARALSAILGVAMAAASAAGLFVRDLYQDPEPVAAMFRGYDLVALVVIVPILAITLLPALRPSARAQLLWLAALAYSVYHSAMYVFGTEFNDTFLLQVAVFSLSVFAFGLAMANVDATEIGRRFARTPVRLVAGILLLLATALAVFWSAPSLRFAMTGELPAEGSKLIVPIAITHLGWTLDLSLLVPAYAVAGILLWRRSAWGYVLATVVLVAGVLQQMEYMSALVFQANADVRGARGVDPFEPVIVTLYLIPAVGLLSTIRAHPAGSPTVVEGVGPERRCEA
jgi:hypothetical protein